MLVYDESSSSAAVQWMGVVQQHLSSVPMTDYLAWLTSTCKASARLVHWKQKILDKAIKQMPERRDEAATCARDASLLYFVLLHEQLARVSAESIVHKPLEHVRKKYVRGGGVCTAGGLYSTMAVYTPHTGGAIPQQHPLQPSTPAGGPPHFSSLSGVVIAAMSLFPMHHRHRATLYNNRAPHLHGLQLCWTMRWMPQMGICFGKVCCWWLR